MDLAKMSSLGEISIPKETEELLKKTYKAWKEKPPSTEQTRCSRICMAKIHPSYLSLEWYTMPSP